MNDVESVGNDNNGEPDLQPPISKRQLKKLAKRQRWLELKPQRKEKEKLKRKLKIQLAKESGRDLGPSRKFLKLSKMSDSSCKMIVCFDLSWASDMTSQEMSKTLKQLHRCYSINRRAPAPLQLHIVGYSDATREKMSKSSGCFGWDVNFNVSPYSKIFEKEKIVYLTSDSPIVLEKLDHEKVYVIGALVDHNRLKNICYQRALEDGVGHAQLPLDMYFKFDTRKVLTIDQVYLILLKLSEGKSWVDAVMEIVPKRKGVMIKESDVRKNVENNLECVKCEDDSRESTVKSSSDDSIGFAENPEERGSSCLKNDSLNYSVVNKGDADFVKLNENEHRNSTH